MVPSTIGGDLQGMDTETLIKLASQGGLGLIIVGAFIWLIRSVGLALVNAVNKQGEKLDAHTVDESEHHTLVREELAQLRGHLGIPTPVHGVPIAVSRQPSSPVRTTVRAKSEPGR